MTLTIIEINKTLTINEGKTIVEIKPVTQSVVISDIGKQGPPGSSEESGAQNVFIQDTQPVSSEPYLWIDTSGGNITIWVEDGV